ncbi:unnamed protein product [Calypogeia fissa]
MVVLLRASIIDSQAIFRHTMLAKKMPRSNSSSSSSSKASKNKSAAPDASSKNASAIPASIRSRPDSSVSIAIHAKPASKVSNITGVGEEKVGVQINAPARDGEANEALLEFMSEVLGVRKRDVSLGTGARSREKIIVVQGMSAESIYSALQARVVK